MLRFAPALAVLVVTVGAAGSAGNASPAGSAPLSAVPFTLSDRQAREVSVTIRFIQAFNRRQLRVAMSLLASGVAVSDCDYARGTSVLFNGKNSATRWLRQRFADRDKLDIARVFNENADQPTGSLGIEYSRRSSDSLRALGFSAGIKPRGVTKVVFTTGNSVLIRAFGNGPSGGSQELCRPTG